MINKNIGAIIKARRVELGLSQQALANIIGVTFQQVQKYEKGSNSLNATRLVDFANALKIPVATFFEQQNTIVSDASDREYLEFVKSFAAIKDYNTRKKLADLTRAINDAVNG